MTKPKLTVLSFGSGQDSTAILYKLIYDPDFRKKYAPCRLIVIMADTNNEHLETIKNTEHVKEICRQKGIPFFFLTGDMGFTSKSWSQGLIAFYEAKNAVGSKAFPKTCTDKLKITPIYNFLDKWIHETYNTEKVGRKQAIKEFTKKTKIDVLIGIAAGEESRASENGNSPHKWFNDSINKIYPLMDLNWNRKACQEYILEINQPLPPPSNCILCPFMSLQELLFLYYTMPEWYHRWVKIEQNKINANLHMGDKNLGVWGKKLLPEILIEAKEKFGYMTIEELHDYKMSHGHCVKSKY